MNIWRIQFYEGKGWRTQLLIINIHLQTKTWKDRIRGIHLHLSVTKRNLIKGLLDCHKTSSNVKLEVSWGRGISLLLAHLIKRYQKPVKKANKNTCIFSKSSSWISLGDTKVLMPWKKFYMSVQVSVVSIYTAMCTLRHDLTATAITLWIAFIIWTLLFIYKKKSAIGCFDNSRCWATVSLL